MVSRHIRFLESFHIPLWLLKDAFWMLDFRNAAIIMILPTLSVAIWITWITRKNRILYMISWGRKCIQNLQRE